MASSICIWKHPSAETKNMDNMRMLRFMGASVFRNIISYLGYMTRVRIFYTSLLVRKRILTLLQSNACQTAPQKFCHFLAVSTVLVKLIGNAIVGCFRLMLYISFQLSEQRIPSHQTCDQESHIGNLHLTRLRNRSGVLPPGERLDVPT